MNQEKLIEQVYCRLLVLLDNNASDEEILEYIEDNQKQLTDSLLIQELNSFKTCISKKPFS